MKDTWKDYRLSQKIFFGSIINFPEPGIVESIASDWDWLWIDCQHGMMDIQGMRSCVYACNVQHVPCIVRVPYLNDGDILQALDSGADGIMVPMIETPEQALMAVAAAKFPPIGKRSFGSQQLLVREGAAYANSANEDTLLVIQLETKTAIENLEAIASVNGVDVLFLSPYDLAISMGNPADKPWPAGFLEKVMKQVGTAAREHKKILGSYLPNKENARIGMRYGCTLLGVTSDTILLKSGSKSTSETFCCPAATD